MADTKGNVNPIVEEIRSELIASLRRNLFFVDRVGSFLLSVFY